MRLLAEPQLVARDHYLLRFELKGSKPRPGQFAELKLTNGLDPLLPRPFSIFDFTDTTIDFIVRIAGKSTSTVPTLRAGQQLEVLCPLGSGFSTRPADHVLLIGGGVGNAPLFLLASALKAQGCRVSMIYGARSAEYVYLEDKFRAVCNHFILCTDDGSCGEKGLVTCFIDNIAPAISRAAICGPLPMMRAASDILLAQGITTEVSLENYFGCGIGLCAGCSVRLNDGRRRKACADGPVFNAADLDWSSIN